MKKLEIVYRHSWIVERIYELSGKIAHRVVDQTLFEDRCMKKVGEYLLRGEGKEKHRNYIDSLIRRECYDATKRNVQEEYTLFSEIEPEGIDGEDEEMEFEPEDVLANVESEVVANETVALLAQDDQRTNLILEMWSIGNDNVAEISRELALALGGKAESHRKQIHRFRNQCRKDSYFTAV